MNYKELAAKYILENDLYYFGHAHEILSITIHPSHDFFYDKTSLIAHKHWHFHEEVKQQRSIRYVDLQYHESYDTFRIRINSLKHIGNGHTVIGAGNVYNYIVRGSEKILSECEKKEMSSENTPELYIAPKSKIIDQDVFVLPRLISGPKASIWDLREVYSRLTPLMATKSFDKFNERDDYPHLTLISLYFYFKYHLEQKKPYPSELIPLDRLQPFIKIAQDKGAATLNSAFLDYKSTRRKKHKDFLALAFGIEEL